VADQIVSKRTFERLKNVMCVRVHTRLAVIFKILAAHRVAILRTISNMNSASGPNHTARLLPWRIMSYGWAERLNW
jgi:hypothetical protein